MIEKIIEILANHDSPVFIVATLSLVVIGLAIYLAILLVKKGNE